MDKGKEKGLQATGFFFASTVGENDYVRLNYSVQ